MSRSFGWIAAFLLLMLVLFVWATYDDTKSKVCGPGQTKINGVCRP